MSNTGQYYFDRMPKEVQDNFLLAYEKRNKQLYPYELDVYLCKVHKNFRSFIINAFNWTESETHHDINESHKYWYGISRTAKKHFKSVSIYTTTDLVSFGNYLLSDARRESITSNPETSPETKTEMLKQVTDADISNWENLNK